MRKWAWVRLGTALLILAAVIAQLTVTASRAIDAGSPALGVTLVNFFSFFTIASNVSAAAVLALAAVRAIRSGPAAVRDSARLSLALACVTTYMAVTGVVYNLLLRGIELPQGTTVPWSNEVLHVVGPLMLVVDFVVARQRRLRWSAVGLIAVPPLLWLGYTLIRGPFVAMPPIAAPGWYPYPFLDPRIVEGGYAGVAAYVLAIALVTMAVGAAVVAIGRRRSVSD